MCCTEMFVDEHYSVMVCECFIGIPINACTVMCIIFLYMLSTLMTTIGKLYEPTLYILLFFATLQFVL